MSTQSTNESVASIDIFGIRMDNDAWELVGYLTFEDKFYYININRVYEIPLNGIIYETKYYTTKIEIYDNIDSSTNERFETIRKLNNGYNYIDRDGDLDYLAIGLPDKIWQFVYGQIFTPKNL